MATDPVYQYYPDGVICDVCERETEHAHNRLDIDADVWLCGTCAWQLSVDDIETAVDA